MGTWDFRSFDNDDALEWLDELSETEDLSPFVETFDAGENEEYLEAPEGQAIIAAAEVINCFFNSPREGIPEQAIKWVDDHKNIDVKSLVPEAIMKLARVLAEDSEIRELWEENEELFPKWLKDVEDLLILLNDLSF